MKPYTREFLGGELFLKKKFSPQAPLSKRLSNAERAPFLECAGYTVVELLVSLVLFGIFSGYVMSSLGQSFRRLGLESRSSNASAELRNAIRLLSSELRMAGMVSPYLPGNDPAATTCGGSFVVTADAVKFLVVHDDQAQGTRAYYVGYRYDPDRKELLRGEVVSSSTTSCATPGVDPTEPGVALVLATRVEMADLDGNGLPDPVFTVVGNTLQVRLGSVIASPHGTVRQNVDTDILVRSL